MTQLLDARLALLVSGVDRGETARRNEASPEYH